jgi:putative AbiEii toxin of type IV toxin-antitoxin system
LNWRRDIKNFLELYLGEGTGGLWKPSRSKIFWQGSSIDLESFVKSKRQGGGEKSFLIPAQRVMAFSRDGWFRPFNDYRTGDPFSVRDFSEKLRRLMESDGGRNGAIYPQPRRLKAEIRELLSKSIFGGFQLELDRTGPQKRLVLHGHGTQIPYMVWSAGQREFVPLLLGLYWLLPSTQPKRFGSIEWVMIEELEMGLHPKAIAAMFFIVLELMWRGYRVCLSTHSPQVLDLVWAFRNLRDHHADPKKILSLFDVKCTPSTIKLARAALTKIAKVYYFDPESRTTRDISLLDPGAGEIVEAGWGGLTELSGRLADVVADAAAVDSVK